MELLDFIEALGWRRHALALMFGLPRLLILLTVAPFLAGQILGGQLKTAVLFAFYLPLHPLVYSQIPAEADFSAPWVPLYLGLAAKEVLVGFVIALVSGLLFWAVQSAGFMIDNQRGASMASGADPLSGEETSPLGSLFFQFLVLLFFATGAFCGFLTLFYQFYQLWPVFSWWPEVRLLSQALFFPKLVDWLMHLTVLLAGPVVVACLLTDIALGLINRFASQLNVYILAMPIKSGVAMLIVLVYLGVLVRLAPGLFNDMTLALMGLGSLWP